MKSHILKTLPEYYQAVIDGRKMFELRKDDRGFEVGDILLLNEFDPDASQSDGGGPTTGRYTGRGCKRIITYILRGESWGLTSDKAILSIRPLTADENNSIFWDALKKRDPEDIKADIRVGKQVTVTLYADTKPENHAECCSLRPAEIPSPATEGGF